MIINQTSARNLQNRAWTSAGFVRGRAIRKIFDFRQRLYRRDRSPSLTLEYNQESKGLMICLSTIEDCQAHESLIRKRKYVNLPAEKYLHSMYVKCVFVHDIRKPKLIMNDLISKLETKIFA